MYEKVAEAYALGANMQQFFAESNPWALRHRRKITRSRTKRLMS